MRRAIAAILLLSLTAACGGDDDDDDDDDVTIVEFADIEPREFDSCAVVGSVFNPDLDRTCTVFLRHEARGFDGDVIADTVVTVDVFPDDSEFFESRLLDENDEFVSCDDVDFIELVEKDDACD